MAQRCDTNSSVIMVFRQRYSGWPSNGTWAACMEHEDSPEHDFVLESLIYDCMAPGDIDAHEASDRINSMCIVAGGESAREALDNLLKAVE